MITTEELEQMKERAEKATAGPWYYEIDGDLWADGQVVLSPLLTEHGVNVLNIRKTDAQFIAHAREDVPRLVAEVERLQSDNEQYYAKIKRLKSSLISAMSLVDECPECVKAFLSDIYEEEFE